MHHTSHHRRFEIVDQNDTFVSNGFQKSQATKGQVWPFLARRHLPHKYLMPLLPFFTVETSFLSADDRFPAGLRFFLPEGRVIKNCRVRSLRQFRVLQVAFIIHQCEPSLTSLLEV